MTPEHHSAKPERQTKKRQAMLALNTCHVPLSPCPPVIKLSQTSKRAKYTKPRKDLKMHEPPLQDLSSRPLPSHVLGLLLGVIIIIIIIIKRYRQDPSTASVLRSPNQTVNDRAKPKPYGCL
ncbi:hypothetical protein BST61_g3832 [Cercospora zeina]